METKFSKGEWQKIAKRDGEWRSESNICIFDGGIKIVARANCDRLHAGSPQAEIEEFEANLDLIAASPKLYQALEWAMKRIEKFARHSECEGDAELYRFALAYAALAQARGDLNNPQPKVDEERGDV